MNRMKKKLLSLLLTACLVAGLVPTTTAFAAGIQSGQPALTVNQSKVAFAGHEWWVIGDDTSGVYPQSDHITLLAANLDKDFQNVTFRNGQKNECNGCTKYTDEGGFEHYYANNPGGMEAWTTPNEYAGSTLQQKMESIAKGFPKKEQAVISARNLASGATEDNNWSSGKTDYIDGIAGSGIADQKLWALSKAEVYTINNIEVYVHDDFWWLRSPGVDDNHAANVNRDGVVDDNYLNNPYIAVLPALSLNLSSVLFTSAAEGGKSSATVGSNLVGAEATTGTVKFTMKDSEQTLKLGKKAIQTGTTLSFSYSDATTGDNQYISCVLTDNAEAVKYYGKLADSSSVASGNFSVPLAGVADGIYTLKIFSEQANGDLYTDFCSEPVTMKVHVSGKDVTVSGFDGEIHKHNWNENAWNSNNTHHWHECTAENCPVTDNSQKDGYAEHTYDQTVAADEYLKSAADCDSSAVYYKSCVCGTKGTDTFTVGNPSGHSWREWVKDTGSDMHTRTCSVCKATETENCLGGTATCKEKAICTVCGQSYGEKDMENHTGTVVWVQTENTHKQVYSCCNVTVSEEAAHQWENGTCSVCQYPCTHTGGTATCSQLAVCDICKSQYGEYDADNHKAVSEWTQENGKHYHKCEYGCSAHLNEADCAGGTATCTVKAVCNTCKNEYGTVDSNNHSAKAEWIQDGDKHYNECANGCGTHLNEADCYGGEATCSEQAICEICKRTYGDPDGANHKGETEIRDAKTATCTEKGYTGDTYCKACDVLLTKGEEIPKTAHDYKDGVCRICGEKDPNVKPSVEPAKPTDPNGGNGGKDNSATGTTSPETGDNRNFALWVSLLLASGGALTAAALYSRKKRKTER